MNYLNILLMLLLIVLGFYKYKEPFDKDMTEFVPIGYKRFGLRGNLLNVRPVDDCYYDKYNCYFNTFYEDKNE
jgi:hypothetical protein